ncbi:MAG: ATP-binding protein [Gammaproteobacteria bacterium]
MSFLLAISGELARIRSPQEVICTAMARLRERLGAARVTVAEFDEARNEAILLRESNGHGERIEVTNLPLDSFKASELGSREGHNIDIPLMAGGKRIAQISVASKMPREWTSSEIELVRRVADIVWPALEKARADRRVTMNEERLRLAQGVAQIGTWDWDPETRVACFSSESRELLGLQATEPEQEDDLQEQWKRNVHPKDLSRVGAMLEECATVRTCEIEYRYLHPRLGERWIYSKAGLVEHAGHRHVVGICLDVTERREAEETLKEVNLRKDEFLAMLAHELRNPLAPIRNAAQLLNVHSAGKPEIEWARAVIERQTTHLVRLVDDLLDVSRMVRGLITLQKKPVELAEIVRNAVEISRPLIRLRKHHLTVELPEEPVLLEADLTRLAQVLSNLLNNAAKYTDEGGQIRLDATTDEGIVTLRLRDTGAGIDPDLLPHVFDLFTQAERTPDRAQGGLGIGLTLVKRLVEMHGGTVEARSEGFGSGAELIVRLPVLASTSEPLTRSTLRVPVVAPADARSLRILIVDDNVDAADSIAMLLSMEGHETRSVNTARAALLAVPDFKPEVVLLDIGLPEMDGYEVARHLRSQGSAHRMRLVAVTGYGQPADRLRAHEAGFDEHMVKPVEPTVLQDFLRAVQSERMVQADSRESPRPIA